MLKTLLIATVAVAAGAQAGAATITYAGSLIDFGPGWRTSVPVQFDPSGLNLLGSNGYYIPGGQGQALTPDYVSSEFTNGSVYPGNGGYIAIDNPSTTPGPTPSTLVTGTFNPFPGTNAATTTFSFTLGAAVPAVIQVGVLEDNLDIAGYNSNAVQLVGPDGAMSSVVTLTDGVQNNRVPDWYVFDITGGVAGQTFSIVNTGGPNGCACLGAVSFDGGPVAGVPEPATWSLLLIGFGLTGYSLRRRNRLRTA